MLRIILKSHMSEISIPFPLYLKVVLITQCYYTPITNFIIKGLCLAFNIIIFRNQWGTWVLFNIPLQ